MPLSAGTRLGPYEILAPIGAGGMGEVYRAKDTKLDRDVAIKVLPQALAQNPERLARFEREAKVLAALNHPNIAQIYGVEERALVMELVEGETLAGPLPLETALNYAKQIADALEAAHEKGITHRDLKPANIMITPAGVVKVLDFGLAAVAPGSAGDSNPVNSPTLTMAATQAGVIMGTAAYMSPEQAAGKPVDKRADIWSFGVVLWEILTARRLFEGETMSHTLAHVLTAPIDFDRLPATTPAVVRDLFRRCLDRDVRNRLRDIGEARIALQEYLADPRKRLRALSGSRQSPRAAWIGWSAAALFMVAALGLSILHFREAKSPAPGPLRFQIPMKQSDVRPFVEFAVSPDGRHLAYMASEGGHRRLWIDSLDSLEALPVQGSEAAVPGGPPIFPFWSPDSRFVAFAAAGKLKKVDLMGGPPQTICDVAIRGDTAGTWNRDGDILFGNNDVLMRVLAGGGVPSQALDARGVHFPFFLPDGQHFLYYRTASESVVGGVYIGSLDYKKGAETKMLFASDSAAVFAPAPDQPTSSGIGHLLYRREGTLLAQRFNANGFEVQGEPLPVSDQIGRFNYFPFYSVSNHGLLVYHTGRGIAKRQFTWFDRKGKPGGGLGEPAEYGFFEISPDGTRVAAQIADQQGHGSVGDIWIFELARGLTTRLTSGHNSYASIWSPDGSRILFSSSRPIDWMLYTRAANGTGQEELLLKSAGSMQPTSWSRDGRHLLYDAAGSNGKRNIWVLPLEGDRKPFPFVRTEFDERFGMFSPDGRWVAYTSDETGTTEIYVRPFPQSEAGKWVVSKGAVSGARWRADGSELYYQARDGSVMVVEVEAGLAFQASAAKALFRLQNPFRFDVMPDGKRFLMLVATTDNTQVGPFTAFLNWQTTLK